MMVTGLHPGGIVTGIVGIGNRTLVNNYFPYSNGTLLKYL